MGTVVGMPRREPLVAVLVGWTLFVWTTRIGNIWRDRSASTGGKVASTALALSFTVLAVVVVVGWLQRRRWLPRAVLVLGVWTVAVWVERSVAIATDHRGTGFITVHAVLAVVSVGLCGAALRRLSAADQDLSLVGRGE
jgi:hypothetical protein